jgi:[pyruvate, water dikinase]-phosphate phosphotransferase / [pyruvate, water dikinase] kinase
MHLHLVSDSTGETASAMARACLVQFEGTEVTEHAWHMVRTSALLDNVIKVIEQQPGLVLFTLIDRTMRQQLQDACWARQIPCVAVLDPVLNAMASYLGVESSAQPGRQHHMDAEYFRRIEAMEYAITHDDGQATWDLTQADVILLGVSRTSKTPTCIYLANRGIKAANIPLVPGVPLPEEIVTQSRAMVVGLTNDPSYLVELRRTRLKELNEDRSTDYIDLERVRAEVQEARKLFSRHGWPVIDVSRRAIEETAAEVMTLLQSRR